MNEPYNHLPENPACLRASPADAKLAEIICKYMQAKGIYVEHGTFTVEVNFRDSTTQKITTNTDRWLAPRVTVFEPKKREEVHTWK